MKRRILYVAMTIMAAGLLATGCKKAEESETVRDTTKAVATTAQTQKETSASEESQETTEDTASATASSTQEEAMNTSKSTEVKEESTKEEDKKITSMFDMYEEISAQVGLDDLMNLDSDTLENYYMISSALYSECAAFQSEDVVVPEIIMFIRAKDKNSAGTLKQILQDFKQMKENELQTYSPEGYEQVKNGEIIVNGNNLYLVISPDKDKIINIINQYN